MKPSRLFIALAVALPALCHAGCERLSVNVLPLAEPTIDTTRSLADLRAMTGVKLATFGGTEVDNAVGSVGCKVTMGYVNPTIYVAREIAANACTLAHVLEHEHEHVAIYRRHLVGIAERMQANRDAPDLNAAAQSELRSVKAAHDAHDSPAEYQRNATACKGALTRFFARD